MKCKLLITYYAGKPRYLSINGIDIFDKGAADRISAQYLEDMAQFNHLIKEIVVEPIPFHAKLPIYQHKWEKSLWH